MFAIKEHQQGIVNRLCMPLLVHCSGLARMARYICLLLTPLPQGGSEPSGAVLMPEWLDMFAFCPCLKEGSEPSGAVLMTEWLDIFAFC